MVKKIGIFTVHDGGRSGTPSAPPVKGANPAGALSGNFSAQTQLSPTHDIPKVYSDENKLLHETRFNFLYAWMADKKYDSIEYKHFLVFEDTDGNAIPFSFTKEDDIALKVKEIQLGNRNLKLALALDIDQTFQDQVPPVIMANTQSWAQLTSAPLIKIEALKTLFPNHLTDGLISLKFEITGIPNPTNPFEKT